MPKYKESSVIGESWKRAFQILIENRYNQIPKIRFSEEEIFTTSDGKVVGTFSGEGIEESFKPENALTEFQLRNPITEEYVDQYATYQDLYILLHSLYFHLAKIRDRGKSPYLSWVYNEELEQWTSPIPKPEDENYYIWNEETVSWVMITDPKPYPSWIYDENLMVWTAPIQLPQDGLEYEWNESTLSWDSIE